MKIYFGEINEHELEEWGTDGLLQRDGRYFSGAVEFGSNSGGIDDVVISDGCGRSIPLSVEHLKQIAVAFNECGTIYNEIVDAQRLQEEVQSTFNYGTVCEHGHIHY